MFSSFKRLFITAFLSLLTFFTFADNWYVCLGSFQSLENAKSFSKKLSENNVPAAIAENYIDGVKHVFRVVLKDECRTAEEARAKRDLFQSSNPEGISDLNGLWICQALDFIEENDVHDLPGSENEEISETEIVQVAEEVEELPEPEEIPAPVVLTVNTVEEIPVSEEKPYSVKIRSYKEEQNAVRDKNRLKEQDIDSYILKTYDDDSLFNFDLHAGAYETEEESEELQEKLENLGITDTEISDYNEIADSIEKYDEVVESQTVTREEGLNTYPGTFAFYVTECIRQFPINSDYQVQNVSIYDVDNLEVSSDFPESDSERLDSLSEYFSGDAVVHAVSYAEYYDDLFDRSVTVAIALGDKDSFEPEDDFEKILDYKFKLQKGYVDCAIYQEDDNYYLLGINDDSSMLLYMKAENFEQQKDFVDFLNNTKNDSSLLFYPQIRKTLAILPDVNPEIQRDFLMFNLYKVPYSYTVERNNSEWSQAMVGHWDAEGYFKQGDTFVEISFFEMDYDYNAKKVHNLFMDSRKNMIFASLFEDKNHEIVDFDKAEAWYSGMRDDFNEMSFSTGSYIIAVDSYSPDWLSESELEEIADDLKIWK